MQIRDFIEKTRAENSARKALEEKAAQKIELFKAATAATQKAAEAGNLQTYSEWKLVAAGAEKEALALREELAAAPRAEEQTIVSAWNAHIKEHNKEFEQKREAYNKARKALCDQFLELLEMQRDALELREDTATLICETCPEREKDYISDADLRRCTWDYSMFGLDAPAMLPTPKDGLAISLNLNRTMPEAAFFIGAGDLPKCMVSGISSVGLHRQPCSRDYLKHGPNLNGFGIGAIF